MEILAADMSKADAYHWMTSVIVPRPIAWVTTRHETGAINVAPFSYFTGLGSEPPLLTLGVSDRRDGTEKDTLRNIRRTEVFCINLVEEHHAEVMNRSSAEYGPDVSELTTLHLDPVPCAFIDGVRIRGARAAMECHMVDVHDYGSTHLVVGEVRQFFIDDELCAAGRSSADPDKIRPVARLGGSHYAKLGERFRIARPKL